MVFIFYLASAPKPAAQSFGKIYSYPKNYKALQSVVAGNYNDLSIQVVPKSVDFKDKFNLGKVPAFEGADGFSLFEASAILQYGSYL